MTIESTFVVADRIRPDAQSQHGHDAYTSLENHTKLSTLSEYKNLHRVCYNPRLGSEEDLHLTDEDTDGSSQGSSDDSSSQSSDSVVAPSPLQGVTAESHLLAKAGPWKAHDSCPRTSKWGQHDNHSRTATTPVAAVPLAETKSNSKTIPTVNSCRTPCQTRRVPFRPKPVDTNTSVPVLQIDTSRVANDVQRSRMWPQEEPISDGLAGRRRGRSACPAGPPRLRRDTEQTDAIVKMIVLFCTNLINSIWSTNSNPETTTQAPGQNVLPLQVFITETLRRSKTSYSTLQIALYYLILLKQCLPPFAQGRQSAPGCRAMQCGRRMFLTALILASKYLQDRNYSARAWSKISGLPLKEINDNERRYLNIVCWDLHVPKVTFENWSKIVLNVCRLSMDPEVCGSESNSQPPPGAGPSSQSCFLKAMSAENISCMRSWWLSNLRTLCTDIIKCPQKTDKYVYSIAPFRDSTYLPRSVIEPSWQDEVAEQEQPTVPKTLHRLPSFDTLSKHFMSGEQTGSPAMTPSLPSHRMLANLPTPLQTPHGADMASMWTPQLGKPSFRCRAAASALSNIDQRRCPIASLSTCPPPKPKPQPPMRSWIDIEAASQRQVPDRSVTSSPDSVVSEAPSIFSVASRSRSSSISSTTSSFSTSACMATEKLQAERLARQLHEAQHRIKLQPTQQTMVLRQAVQAGENIERPRTAFKPHPDPETSQEPAAHKERFVDEGYGSDDHAKAQRENPQRDCSSQAPVSCENGQSEQLKPCRPGLVRHQSQYYTPGTAMKTHCKLKRCRSESLDLISDKSYMVCVQGAGGPTPKEFSPWDTVADLCKRRVPPSDPNFPSRMPVQYGGAQSKRIALQSPSPAVEATRTYLQQDILAQG